MTSKFLKRLVRGTLVIVFWSVSVKAGFPQSAAFSPYLSFKFSEANNQKGKSPQSPVILKRAERLEFQIQYVTNAPYRPSRGIDYGPLSIRAINQHPDFFKERPGPTVSLELTRVSTDERELLPIRIFSSGQGYGDGVHYLSVSIDILEPQAVRQNRLSQFISHFRDLASASGFSGTGAINESARLQGAQTYFDEFYIGNPPGVYNLKTVFQPDPAVAQGRILTASALVRVLEGPDSLDLLKQKLAEKRK
ncbi:MAG TPA: hypothetical protein VGK77_00320 [Candidatus Binatia bacterium]|jgi:hypothetical protein